ncbi:hypothetical protein ACIPSE_23630 [Streptomyces sp. NPDC090106]|uniref:hypothetical protein n=1 Tax=Streptomyces sp. NPDC090106 TaxID=3365946 RepID=UPI003803F2B4
MNCLDRLLSVLYVSTSAGLAWTAVLEYRDGPVWAACLFAAAALVPVIAVVREAEWRERAALWPVHPAGPALVGPALVGVAEDVVRAELEAACCERWWTSCGTDHDSGCPHRVPRSSAA